MNEDLARFVEHAREKGLDLATIRQVLGSAGWSDHDITEAFCARELDLPVPVPAGAATAAEPLPPFSFKDTLFQVLSFSALYTWVISLIVLFFTYINDAFPDAALYESDYRGDFTRRTIRWSLAALIVSFPVFLLLWRVVLRDLQQFPEKARGMVRRGLTYLSLLVGALTLAIDVIVLVYYLFEGEATTRFLLKVFVLFIITGAVFLYLAFTLQPERAAGEDEAAEAGPEPADEPEPAAEVQP